MNKLMLMLILAASFGLNSCATSPRQHSMISAPSLGSVAVKLDKVGEAVKAKDYQAASKALDAARKEVNQKQNELEDLTLSMRAQTDRLNYLEVKYSESVGLLWKWRIAFIVSTLVSVAAIGWIFRGPIFALIKIVGIGAAS